VFSTGSHYLPPGCFLAVFWLFAGCCIVFFRGKRVFRPEAAPKKAAKSQEADWKLAQPFFSIHGRKYPKKIFCTGCTWTGLFWA